MMIGNNNTVNLAFNSLNATTKAMEKTARALSTGLKAATAADDAAGFAISMNISANAAGVDRAIRNSQDGISMLQTAEGGLNQINSMLQRMRELTIQAANDTLTTQDRNYIQMEIDGLKDTINSMASNTTFNNKRLLDGSSAAIWSSDNASTKVRVMGVLTSIDQFGQKKTADGNYRIEVKANAGTGQVQKSSPMIISRKDTIMDKSIDTTTGVNSLTVNDLPAGRYTVSGEQPGDAEAVITGSYGIDADTLSESVTASVSGEQSANASILFEVKATDTGRITLQASSSVLTTDGMNDNIFIDNIFLTEDNTADLSGLLGPDTEAGTFGLSLSGDAAKNFKAGDKFIYNITAGEGNRTVKITGKDSGTEQKFSVDTEAVMNRELHFRSFNIDGDSGKVHNSTVTIATSATQELADDTVYAQFRASESGEIPEYDAALRDINIFYDSEGVYMFDRPQKITLTQGDGKQASITVYGTDTLEDLRAKLNNAIADGLGQALYADNKENFVSFVREGYGTSGGSEAVAGTFVIRSAVAGSAGKITLTSENNDLISALGLNTIQEGIDNNFTATVYDAHTGKPIASNITTDGNNIRGVISPNVEVEFDSMSNVQALWNNKTKSYDLVAGSGVYTTTVHISDRSTAFQVGARDGEDMFINIGDMRSEALGLNKVDVSSRDRASESIAVLDAAIRKVSLQRTKVGSYQNELEYNYNSLTQTSLHLQESESRIKDADMASEYMEFVKLQILSNTGSSMLSQAQQNSQAVMNILNM